MILVHDGAEQLELLLVRRTPRARFMAGVWVFPGGGLSPQDGEGQLGLMKAARRELAEETGIVLPSGHELVAFMRWITPEEVRTRFDTWFYLAAADHKESPTVDGQEIVDAVWINPAEALRQASEGTLELAFPTIRQLQQLSEFNSVTALLGHARANEVQAVRPKMVGEQILLPGDAGYI